MAEGFFRRYGDYVVPLCALHPIIEALRKLGKLP